MEKKHVILSINGTFYDMIGEYYYFISEVFPEVKKIAQSHNIELEYRDVAFSAHDEIYSRDLILRDLNYIDDDRTFFICFRGQRIGWIPTANDVTKLTLDEYPELVKHINGISLTELVIMHALRPFYRIIDGEKHIIQPTRHSLFYFRNGDYMDDIDEEQKSCYGNVTSGEIDKEVKDYEIAKAKDLVFDFMREFRKIKGNPPRVIIDHYNVKWRGDVEVVDILRDYVDEYVRLNGQLDEDFFEIHKNFLCKNLKGSLGDFEYEGRPLKDVIINDLVNELRIEFPENFKD